MSVRTPSAGARWAVTVSAVTTRSHSLMTRAVSMRLSMCTVSTPAGTDLMSTRRCRATSLTPRVARRLIRWAGIDRLGKPRRVVLLQATPTVNTDDGGGSRRRPPAAGGDRYRLTGAGYRPLIFAGRDIRRSQRASGSHAV